MSKEDGIPAAIYVRISRDREGAGLGVDRQEADCRELAKRLGWKVQQVYVDNDISAYSGKARPEYRALLEAVTSGRVRGILAWHTDRLHRRATELEEFVTIAEQTGLQVETVTAGKLDLSTPSGRMVARMLSAAAQHEVEHTKEKIRRQKSQAANAGKYRGGPRPYGYEADGMTVREAEAEVVREMTTAVLAERSLRALARELNDRGLTTSTGKPWTYQRLRDVLIRPRNAGLLHRGRADRRAERRPDREPEFEIVGPARWPAIVDEEEWRAVHALLIDPSRSHQQGNATRWLGAGIYVCGRPTADGGICGGFLRAAPHGGTASRPHQRRFLYRCVESAHLTIAADATDGYVREVVADLVRHPRTVAMLSGSADQALRADRERRQLLVTRLDQTETDYDEDLIDARRYKAKVEKITAELIEVEERISDGVQAATISPIFGEADPGAAFLAAPVDVQRAVLRSVLRVQVGPALYRGSAWSSERLDLTKIVAA
jgi:DNA invertase Pin-like site-specific DNA recombinase